MTLNPYMFEAGISSPIKYRGCEWNGAYNVSSVTIQKPTGTAYRDLLVAHILINDGSPVPTITPPSGWTLLGTVVGAYMYEQIYYKVATSSEPTSYTWSHDVIKATIGSISAHYNEDGQASWTLEYWSSKINTSTTAEITITTNSVDCVDNCLLLCLYGNPDSENPDTAPSDMILSTNNQVVSVSIADYYENRNAGAVTKTIIWEGGTERYLTAWALVFTSDL